MNSEAVVSRSEIFGNDGDQVQVDNTSEFYAGFGFEEIEVGHINDEGVTTSETAIPDDAPKFVDDQAMEFQLFAGSETMKVDLRDKFEEVRQTRPLTYYIFQPDEQKKREFRLAAVTGDFVIREAEFWKNLASGRPLAEDINKNFVPKKRKCRPGKQARLNKKLKHERIEQLRKHESERWNNRRHGNRFRPKPKAHPGLSFR